MIEIEGPIQINTVHFDGEGNIAYNSQLFIGNDATVDEALEAALEGRETITGGALDHIPLTEQTWLARSDCPATKTE